MADELDERLLPDFSEAERCLNEGRLRECAKRLRTFRALVETAGSPPRWLAGFLLLQGHEAETYRRREQALRSQATSSQ